MNSRMITKIKICTNYLQVKNIKTKQAPVAEGPDSVPSLPAGFAECSIISADETNAEFVTSAEIDGKFLASS